MSAPQPARGRPARIVLEGRYCRLEPLRPEHAADLYAATAGDGEAERYRWLLNPPPANADALAAGIAAAAQPDDPLDFAVVDLRTGRAAGRQSLMRIAPEHGVIEIGAILWGRGVARTRLATEAFFLFAQYSFDTLGYRRFEWKCNARNAPSRRAAERFGFTYEGIFRQHMIVKGENRDTAWFSVIDSEWPALRAEYERWLAPGNFDSAGNQLTPLAARRPAA